MSIENIARIHIVNETGHVIYSNRAPNDAVPPYAIQRTISKTVDQMGMSVARIQWDIFGISYAQVKVIAADFNAELRTFDDTDVVSVIRGNELDTYENDLNLHRVIFDAIFRYEELPTFD